MENVKRLFDIPYYQLKQYPQEKALVSKINGKWVAYSTQKYVDMANQVSRGLLRMGIKPGDKVAMISNNRPEWNIMDIGIMQIGAINVPIYPTISENDYKFIFNDAEVKLCIVSDNELLSKANLVKDQVPTLQGIYSFEEIAGAKNWSEILDQGKDESNQNEVQAIMDGIKDDELATLIYTSGTTGVPKGVMLCHRNIVSNALGSMPRLPVDNHAVSLSFLPVCHIYERMILYLYQLVGVSIHFAESIDTIADNIREIKPNVFTAVPRLLEKVYDKIVAGGTEAGGIKAKIFLWALGLTQQYEYGMKKGLKWKIADKLVFSKIRAKLGGNIQAVASGSAALQPRLAQFFHAVGIPVFEGYGLTETSPVISVNAEKSGVVFGSVGKLLDGGVEVKIAEDGEILTKGPNLMMGYYKRPDLTEEVIDKDGWFHTGDIGKFIQGDYLKITDRKKEMFKTSGGKYVAPQVLENKFKESRFIEQVMVIGANEKHPAALIVPGFAFLTEWCERKGIKCNGNAEMCANEKVIARIQEEVDEYNKQFGNWEQVKKFELLSAEWGVETKELTPTLKLKRKVIMEMYHDQVEKIYRG
jgi:long-chain acyl-CoA synthetase